MITELECHTLQEHIKSLASHMPGGKLWASKNIATSDMYQLLSGIAQELVRAEETTKALQNDYIPSNTQLFTDEWEKALGIPDDCFDGAGTPEERNRDILIKLASLGVQTEQDFLDLAALFGVTVTIIPGNDYAFPYTIPFLLGTGPFAWVVEYSLADAAIIPTIECLFNKLKPAHTIIYFVGV